MNINDILPAKKSSFDEHQYNKPYPQYLAISYEEKYKREGYNAAIDDCAAALSKHNLVVCPTEQQIAKVLFPEFDYEGISNTIRHQYLRKAKALLALMKEKS